MEQRENYKKNVVYTCIVKLQEECGIYMNSKITRGMWYIHV